MSLLMVECIPARENFKISDLGLVSFAAGMSRNAPPKETAAHIRTTFLSHCLISFREGLGTSL